MYHDICDGAVTLDRSETVAHWNAMIVAFLAHGKEAPVHLGRVLEAEPDFALGFAAKGLFSMMMGRSELVMAATEAHATAKAFLRAGAETDRDRLWVDALGAWLAGRPSVAVETLESVLRQNPRDTLTAKVIHAIRFILGDKDGMRRSIERILHAHGADHPCRGYLLGCYAFTLEETGDYDAAERTGLQGLDYAADDAWGLHAVAHVYDMTARPDHGIRLIENNTSAWAHCNNFRYHVWWHKALLHLDRGEMDKALSLYDHEIRAEKTDDYRDISNATSLLVRLELEGLDIGNRWEELADIAETRVEDGCLVFADLHYMLALAAAGRSRSQAALQIRYARQAQGTTEMDERIADPGQAALVGLNAFSEGRYDTAFRNLVTARPAMQTIGGSHAQRDVFERITVDAGLRAGHVEQVETVLRDRLNRRGGHADRFAETRFDTLAQARRIPAE